MGTFAEIALSITVYLLPTKKNKLLFPFPFAANKQKFSVSVFCLQKINGSCPIPLVQFPSYGNMEKLTGRHRHVDMKT
jgi:hypothetical protein